MSTAGMVQLLLTQSSLWTQIVNGSDNNTQRNIPNAK